MKSVLCASLFLLFVLSACGPAAPATTAPTAPAAPPTVAPAATSVAPTAVPATATSVPPSPTAVPATATSVPPTATALPATATAIPATATLAPATPTLRPPTPIAVANGFLVNVKNFEFMPRDIKIAKGTIVTWVVLQGQHTTTSDDFRSKAPNSWHSGDLQTGQKFSFTFNTPGTYRFFCGFHSEPGQPLTVGNMNGQVTVE